MGWLKDLKVKAGQGLKDWNDASDASFQALRVDDWDAYDRQRAEWEEELKASWRSESPADGVQGGRVYLGGKVIPVNQITGVSLSPDGRQVSIETAGGTTVVEGPDAKNIQRQITNAMG